MRVLTWLFNLVLFVLALGFALSNTATVELRFVFADLTWRAPLVVVLLVFLAAGVALGLLAAVPLLFRHRREITRLTRELRHATRPPSPAPPAQTPPVVAAPAETAPGSAAGLGV